MLRVHSINILCVIQEVLGMTSAISLKITPPLDNSFEGFLVCPKQVQHHQSILINQPGAPVPGYWVDGCLSDESPFGMIQSTGHSVLEMSWNVHFTTLSP